MVNTYAGKHKRLFSVFKDKRTTTITVYLDNGTLVIKVDDDGSIETSLEPI